MTFTHEYMKDNCGCYDQEQLMNCSFMSAEPVTLQSIIESEIPLKDKYWFVCRKLATKEQNQQIAIDVAELVLPIFENRYPDDKRPHEAIEAAKQYIAGSFSLETLRGKRLAAHAAAADAAYAAAHAAAAYAAYAAAHAAAADAADAAAYAADAAYAAAYAADAGIKQKLLDYIKQFTSSLNVT